MHATDVVFTLCFRVSISAQKLSISVSSCCRDIICMVW